MIAGDIIGIIQAAIQVGQAIKGKSDQVKANKKQCKELENHVAIVIGQLDKINENTPCHDSLLLKQAASALGGWVKECGEFISKFAEKHHWYQRVLHSGSNAQSFKFLHSKLFKYSQQLTNAIGIQLLDSYRENTQAILEDINELEGIINKTASLQLGTSESLKQIKNEQEQLFASLERKVREDLGRLLEGQKKVAHGFIKAIVADKRPTDAIYALMSQQVYEGEQLKQGSKLGSTDWTIEKIYIGKNGYCGIIYANYSTNQIVVAHRGTNGLAIPTWLESFREIYHGELISQYEEASVAVSKAVKLAKQRGAHLSFTGHSLGAFLAELSVAYCYSDSELGQVNAVVFESPGSQESMKKLQPNLTDVTRLDIIEYLSYPNRLNSCNHHAGTIYQLPGLGQPGWNWSEEGPLTQWHLIKALAEQFKNGASSKERVCMQAWPINNEQEVLAMQAEKLQFITTSQEAEVAFGLPKISPPQEEKALKGPNVLPLRHFDLPLQEMLVAFYSWWQEKREDESARASLKALKIPEKIITPLLGCQLIECSSGIALKLIDASKDVHTFRADLSSWLSEEQNQKSLAQLLTETNTASFDLMVAIVAPGALIGKEAVLEKVKALGCKVVLPEGAADKDVEHINVILHQFKTNTKARVYGVAPGAIVKGKMTNCSATAFELEMVKRATVSSETESVQEAAVSSSNSTLRKK